MNLRELHSPAPLRDADYAAVRARVIGEIAARRRRWRWALAFAATLAIALRLQMPKPQPHPQTAVPQWGADVLTGASSTSQEPAPVRTPAPHKEAKKPAVVVPGEPVRIELHTSDPDIRIIWIVNPTKEES